MAIRYGTVQEAKPSREHAPASRLAKPAPTPQAPAPAKGKSAPVITPRQIRAGRALLGWNQEKLAEKAKVGRATLARIEASMTNPTADTLKAIRKALKDEGVRLYDDSDGVGEGARMAKPDGDA